MQKTSFFSSSSVFNRYRFSSIASSPKPSMIVFPQTTRASRVLSMSNKDDKDDKDDKYDKDDKDDGTDGFTYKDSGVDINAGNELIKRISKMAPRIGGFSGRVPRGIDTYYKTAKFHPNV